LLIAALLAPSAPSALIFASPETEPPSARPPDFPYWDNVLQRRYDGPTVIYLGAGVFLTASHVGWGEVLLGDDIVLPDFGWRHTLMNEDGSGADAMLFRMRADVAVPRLPILPLADTPPRPGEEVLLIGFGAERAKVTEWVDAGRIAYGFEWSERGRKHWGTNRVALTEERTVQLIHKTEVFSFVFDEPRSPNETRHEAQAAHGDSGGAVFVERDGEWQLAGMMISVSNERARPERTSMYGDSTYVLDISAYRDELMRWARPVCANELDDDGDQKVDFPLDPGCHSQAGHDERDVADRPRASGATEAIGVSGLAVLVGASMLAFRRGARR
jgi:hypothetical protein